MGLRNTKNNIEISMYFSRKVSISLENDPFCEVNFQKKKKKLLHMANFTKERKRSGALKCKNSPHLSLE